jgi:hypothetical protein
VIENIILFPTIREKFALIFQMKYGNEFELVTTARSPMKLLAVIPLLQNADEGRIWDTITRVNQHLHWYLHLLIK